MFLKIKTKVQFSQTYSRKKGLQLNCAGDKKNAPTNKHWTYIRTYIDIFSSAKWVKWTHKKCSFLSSY